MFHADLHIHSKFSRACSKDCDIEHLSWWALRKGLRVLGTGDFTHPAWFDHLKESLVEDAAGLFRYRDEDAIRKHHAALGVDCGAVHRVDGIT